MSKAIHSVPLSPFNNLSAADLVDDLGSVKSQIADLEAREKSLRDELVRRGVSECQGAAFSAQITEAIRWTLNTQTVKAEMGETWWNARCRQSAITTVTVKPLVATAVPEQRRAA